MVGALEGSRAGEPTAVRANPWARPPEMSEKVESSKPEHGSISDAATHIQATSSTSSDEAKEVTNPIVPIEAGEARDEVDDDTALGWEWLGEDPRVSIPSADSNDVVAVGSTTAPTVPRPSAPGERLDARSRYAVLAAIAAVAGLIVAVVAIVAIES